MKKLIYYFFLISVMLFNSACSGTRESELSIQPGLSEVDLTESFLKILLRERSQFLGEDEKYYYVATSNGGLLDSGETPTLMEKVICIKMTKIDPHVLARFVFEKTLPYQGVIIFQLTSSAGQQWYASNCNRLHAFDYGTQRTIYGDQEAVSLIQKYHSEISSSSYYPEFRIIMVSSENEFLKILSGIPSLYEGKDKDYTFLSTSSPDRILKSGEMAHPFEMIVKIDNNKIQDRDLNIALKLNQYIHTIPYPSYPVPSAYIKWKNERQLKKK